MSEPSLVVPGSTSGKLEQLSVTGSMSAIAAAVPVRGKWPLLKGRMMKVSSRLGSSLGTGRLLFAPGLKYEYVLNLPPTVFNCVINAPGRKGRVLAYFQHEQFSFRNNLLRIGKRLKSQTNLGFSPWICPLDPRYFGQIGMKGG